MSKYFIIGNERKINFSIYMIIIYYIYSINCKWDSYIGI